MARRARRDGVASATSPHFPIHTLTLMRDAVGVQMRQPEMRQPADFERKMDTVFRALWEPPCHVGDPAVLAQVLQRAGFDVGVKARLVAHTEEAVARGVFGAPTLFVGQQMFFSQDRLEFAREASSAGTA